MIELNVFITMTVLLTSLFSAISHSCAHSLNVKRLLLLNVALLFALLTTTTL